MNSTLKNIIQQAEGRHLSDSEKGEIRSFALGMSERLEVASRLAEREETIVAEVLAALPRDVGNEDLVAREVRGCLRAAAHGLVREDRNWFVRSYVRWNVTMACRMLPPGAAGKLFETIRSCVERSLDAADARQLAPFLGECVRGAGEA